MVKDSQKLGPRARILGLEWDEPKSVKKKSKKKLVSLPRKKRKTRKLYDPRAISQNNRKLKFNSYQQSLNTLPPIIFKDFEMPDDIEYEVIYLDNE